MKNILFLLGGVVLTSFNSAMTNDSIDHECLNQTTIVNPEPINNWHNDLKKQLSTAMGKELSSQEFDHMLKMLELFRRNSAEDLNNAFDIEKLTSNLNSEEDTLVTLNFLFQIISASQKQ